MKQKLLGGLAAALLSLSLTVSPASAAPRPIPVTVDGALLQGVSYVDGGVTTVPLRTLLDAVGGWHIRWDAGHRHGEAKREIRGHQQQKTRRARAGVHREGTYIRTPPGGG